MWADNLVIEYEQGRKELEALKNNLGDSDQDKVDKSHINSMIDDMSYAIDWMKVGRRPGTMRGVDKRSAYQRRVLMDMDMMPALDIEPEREKLSEETKQLLFDLLIDLSHRERHCYLLHMAHGWSMQEIADEFNMGKSTVQKYIERAKKKVKSKVSCRTNVV